MFPEGGGCILSLCQNEAKLFGRGSKKSKSQPAPFSIVLHARNLMLFSVGGEQHECHPQHWPSLPPGQRTPQPVEDHSEQETVEQWEDWLGAFNPDTEAKNDFYPHELCFLA